MIRRCGGTDDHSQNGAPVIIEIADMAYVQIPLTRCGIFATHAGVAPSTLSRCSLVALMRQRSPDFS